MPPDPWLPSSQLDTFFSASNLFTKLKSCLTFDFPRTFPSLSVTAMPSMSSVCLIKGILIQLAAATAVKGTHLFTMGGALCVSGQDASELYTTYLDNIWLQFVHSSARILARVYYMNISEFLSPNTRLASM